MPVMVRWYAGWLLQPAEIEMLTSAAATVLQTSLM
jgi:hypothetical protein